MIRPERRADFGWLRGVLTAVVILIVGLVAVVYVTNLLVTKLTGVDRHARVALGTIWFFLSLFSLAFVLRRLQSRGIV